MSVINRMLADLERRGSPGARNAPASGADAKRRPRWRWRPWPERGVPVLLLAGLLLVAAALWRERAPDVLALMEQARTEAGQDAAGAGLAADIGSTALAPPTIAGIFFDADERAARLTVDFSQSLPEPPGYRRSGERIVLRLPAAWDGRELPTPPSDSGVFRSLTVTGKGNRVTQVALTVADDARFDLSHRGDRLRVTGRRPAPDTAGQDASAAATAGNGTQAGTSAGTDTAGTDAATGEPATDSNAVTAAANGAGSDGTASQPATDTDVATSAQGDASEGAATTGEAGAAAAGEEAATTRGDEDTATAETDGGEGTAGDGEIRKSDATLTPAERARQRESQARDALQTGDLARARDRLRAALAADPDRHSARELLVRLALRGERTQEARNLLADGLQRAPRRAGFAKPYARLLVDDGELERALRILERAQPAGDGDAGYHGLTAAIAQRLERHELAAEAYTRALGIDRGRGVWWLGLGISLAATDRPERARAAFRNARASGDLDQRLDDWAARRIEALAQE